MHRRFSSMVGKAPANVNSPSNMAYDDKSSIDDASTINEEVLVPPSLKVKRVDHYYSKWSKSWKYRNTSSKVRMESVPILNRADNDPWKDCLFVIVRQVPTTEAAQPTFKIVIKSEYILKICKDVIQSWPGISWNSDPLELDPEIFLTFLDDFTAYQTTLSQKKPQSNLDKYLLSSLTTLLTTLHSDQVFKSTIENITRLKTHHEITFDLLYSILIPRTLFVARCAVTEGPRIFKLMSWTPVSLNDSVTYYQLVMEGVELVDNHSGLEGAVTIGRIQTTVLITKFKGTVPINSLDIYPIRYMKEGEEVVLRERVMRRGKKWVELMGVHHKEYDGIAAVSSKDNARLIKQTVTGRIMIDRVTFRRNNPNYPFPTPVMDNNYFGADAFAFNSSMASLPSPGSRARGGRPRMAAPPIPPMPPSSHPVPWPNQGPFTPPFMGSPYGSNRWANGTLVQSNSASAQDRGIDDNTELTEEQLLLTPTVVYGFSLSDKMWLEFSIDKITDVQWNDEAFTNLVLPADRKWMLRSLVEAHHRETFDDFIKGKGHGLVINLFGPTGVGKTFSAEATSEHVKRPLYIVGAGDLGTDPANMDLILEKIFDLATAWKAIVLIDEADVFMEQRSLHDLKRNALVAVFLRHVEYYRGILFLTTNRVKAFDEAFLSRIHVALHFHDLPFQSKIEVWTAFIKKIGALDSITAEEIRILAQRDVNGRQIKNAVKTAQSMALGKGESLGFGHFMQTLDAMEGFKKEFERVRALPGAPAEE